MGPMLPAHCVLLGLCLGAPAPEEAGVAIQVRPRAVYRRMRYTVEARVEDPAARGLPIAWKASAGVLLRDRGPRVVWNAPPVAGTARIEVEVGSPAVRRASILVQVAEASREGMVAVPAGVFTMGDTWTDTSDPRHVVTEQNKVDKPSRRVHLDEYLIDRHKVTNRRYAAFLDAALAEGIAELTPTGVVGRHEGTPVHFFRFAMEEPPTQPREVPPLLREIRLEGGKLAIKPGCEEHPVVDVTWPGAAAFAAYHGKRLPTEAEWEKAARGQDNRRYPWGDELPTRFHANFSQFHDGPTPVGAFSPRGDSPYGAADMLGGCHEWVQDWFSDDLFADTRSDVPLRNPAGPEWGFDRVVRGMSRVDFSVAGPREAGPLSFRYHWGFEFAYGDGFAHAHTGFRTALSP